MIQIGAIAATLDSPIEHLMACHRRIEQRLDTLINAGSHVGANPVAALNAIRNSFEFLDTSGVLHTEDEEASLFPRLRQKLSASEIAMLDALEAQHVEAEFIYSELRRLASQLKVTGNRLTGPLAQYQDCANQLRLLYRSHIRLEEEIVTPGAKRSLDRSELAEISREMRDRRARTSKVSVV